MNAFEQLLKDQPATAENWKEHIIAVADTMYLCQAWFESYGLAHTASDIVAMAGIIVERENLIGVAKMLSEDISGHLSEISDTLTDIAADVDRAVAGEEGGRGYVRVLKLED